MAEDTKVLRWAQLFQPMILVVDRVRNSTEILEQRHYGDGDIYGNGDGRELGRGNLHRKGGGTGNGGDFKSVTGGGSSMVMRDGNGATTRY